MFVWSELWLLWSASFESYTFLNHWAPEPLITFAWGTEDSSTVGIAKQFTTVNTMSTPWTLGEVLPKISVVLVFKSKHKHVCIDRHYAGSCSFMHTWTCPSQIFTVTLSSHTAWDRLDRSLAEVDATSRACAPLGHPGVLWDIMWHKKVLWSGIYDKHLHM